MSALYKTDVTAKFLKTCLVLIWISVSHNINISSLSRFQDIVGLSFDLTILSLEKDCSGAALKICSVSPIFKTVNIFRNILNNPVFMSYISMMLVFFKLLLQLLSGFFS